MIKDDYSLFVRNQNKRKTQEAELNKYKEKALEYQDNIKKVNSEIADAEWKYKQSLE